MANKKYCKIKAQKYGNKQEIIIIEIPNTDLFYKLEWCHKGYFWILNNPKHKLINLNKYKYTDILKIKQFVFHDLKQHEEFLILKHC